ncbi:MAG: hypothetical protein K2N51_18665 [Lachnospiraceae bacterium]|nr:hypothetical protein [Lachnospiraceae bacterium]
MESEISKQGILSNDLKVNLLIQYNFKTQVGSGVYDIYSPKIPSVEEI